MELPYFSPWQLLLLPAIWLYWSQPSHRAEFRAAIFTALPIILLVPILSQSFFGLFSLGQGLLFLAAQAVTILAVAILASYTYEQGIRPKISRSRGSHRHRYLLFLVGVALSVVLFDLLGQPLVVSLIFGMGINLLLAVRYYGDQLNEILFSILLMGVFYLFIYTVVLFDLPGETARYWFNDQVSGSVLFGLAVEKVLVILLYGGFWGPIYIAIKDVLAKR
ncbi:MAG: hypothetical protein WEC83_00700 [Patescibacteria group bacterium]